MSHPIPAAIAFFALGANFLGTILLLLVNPRSRAVRWYAAFQADLMLWLATQGWFFASGETGPVAGFLFEASIHMLPGLFVAVGLVECRGVRPQMAWVAVAISACLLPITLGSLIGPSTSVFTVIWQIAGWGIGTSLHVRAGVPEELTKMRSRLRGLVGRFLGLGVPAIVVLGWLTGGDGFFHYAMPLITVAIQVLIFFGVIYLRFYDVEVRSSHRGELAADAADLQRNALVGELAASFAHEVRNPLTGVRSLAQRLAEDEVGEPDRRRYAEVIMREVGRVEQIVANLLAFARRAPFRSSEPGPIELEPLFDDLRILVASRAERAGVSVEVEPRDLRVSATREALAQTLLNLLLNAIQHSPEGGRVSLQARANGDVAELLVRDQGPGVLPAERERVFEPLYSSSGGSGLGLAVVRRIAAESGWRVEVTDAPAGGAEFCLRVPLTSAATAAVT